MRRWKRASARARAVGLGLGILAALALSGMTASPSSAERSPPYDLGPVPVVPGQDVVVSVFFPPRVPEQAADPAQAFGPKVLVHLRLFDDVGDLIKETTAPVVPGQGAALEVATTEIFEQDDPPWVAAQVVRELVDPLFTLSAIREPPWRPSLQLLDTTTGTLELVIHKEPPFSPAGQVRPDYLPPISVAASEEVVLSYAGQAGEEVLFTLTDRTGAVVVESGPWTVPETGGLEVAVDGMTLTAHWTPPVVVPRVERLGFAEKIDPPYLPASLSVSVTDGATGKVRGLVGIQSLPPPAPPFIFEDGGTCPSEVCP